MGVLENSNKEDEWYYKFLRSDKQFEVNIHSNLADGPSDEITVFIDWRIIDEMNKTIGVVGVGIKTDYLRNMIATYERDYNVEIFFIDKTGKIEVSSYDDGNQGKNI